MLAVRILFGYSRFGGTIPQRRAQGACRNW